MLDRGVAFETGPARRTLGAERYLGFWGGAQGPLRRRIEALEKRRAMEP